jgi:putative ABC transport system substrate-binding protein
MKRREFVTLVGGAAAWSTIANAQQSLTGASLIGVLWPGNPSSPVTLSGLKALSEALREEGYVEDRNIKIQYRYAENLDGLKKAADELAALNVNVIVAAYTPAVIAAMSATKNIPIVGTSMADPVADGLIASLARPGGNVTGNTFLGPELEPKRLQLLRDVAPGATHIAALQHPGIYGEVTMRNMVANIEEAAKANGVNLHIVSVHGPNDFDSAFESIVDAGADALIVLPSPMFYQNYRRLVDLAARHRLPTMYVFKEAVEGGGLMSYGADIPGLAGLAGKYVVKILKGAKPSDLPVEQPVKFDLAINLKTARTLGLTIPHRCWCSRTRSLNERRLPKEITPLRSLCERRRRIAFKHRTQDRATVEKCLRGCATAWER